MKAWVRLPYASFRAAAVFAMDSGRRFRIPDCWAACFFSGSSDSGFGSFRDQRAFELGNGAEHLQGKHDLCRRSVNGITEGKWVPLPIRSSITA